MKKRKSGNDIKLEISKIIDSSNSNNDLICKIEKYLDSLTGNELIPKPFIRGQIYIQLRQNNKFNVLQSAELKKMLGINENWFKNIKNDLRDFSFFELTPNPLMASILLNCKQYEKIVKDNPKEELSFFVKNDKTLLKIEKFLWENKDVRELFFDYVTELPLNTIFEKIINREIPLSTITQYFNYDYDIKQNTLYFYKKLDKKFTNGLIQQTLIKWISKKKKKG